MTLKTVLVTGTLFNPDGSPATNARGSARLTRYETDGGVVVPSLVQIATDEAGEFAIELWPNERGSGGSQYRVEVAGGRQLLLNVLITVPDVEGPVVIESIINGPPYPPVDAAQLAVMQAQAAALEAKGYRDDTAELTDETNARLQFMENVLQVMRYGDGPYPIFEHYFIGPNP